ncbi:MAG: LON peptidase substrate-binding domain-containing protein [Enterovibrio sp.]
MRMGLFTVPILLLPGGITKLRVWENRYIRLVKQALEDKTGFVLAMKEGDNICAYGTQVEIIDFELLPDGFLGITVKATARVHIHHILQEEEDNLWVGYISVLPDWPDNHEQANELGVALKALFSHYPEHIKQFGDAANFSELRWVCQRWLEIVPLTSKQKQWLISQSSLDDAKNFLSTILYEEPSNNQHTT